MAGEAITGDAMRMNLRALLSTPENILILGHQNADPDAVCSMIALQHLYTSFSPTGKITLACDDVSKLATQVLSSFTSQNPILEHVEGEFDLVVVLDTNSPLQLGTEFESYVSDPSKVVIIDHHEPNPTVHEIADFTLIDTDASSTCEVLANLYTDLEVPLRPSVASLLLAGMLFDTRRFYYVGARTLQTALYLLDQGADYEECIHSLTIKPDRSERIARLKAASRLSIHTIDNWVVVTAKVGAFEASACRGLIDLGADVAIVAGKPSKGVVRVSARSTREFYEKTGINLGTDIMEPIGDIIAGKGGGHPNAAGANGVRNRGKALEKSVVIIQDLLKRKTEIQWE